MKQNVFSLARAMGMLTVILSLWGCRPDRVDSAWLSVAPPDGQAPDWQRLPGYRLDEIQGIMTLANDGNTLYLRLVSHDPRLAMRLNRNGMMIWLSGPSKDKERLGIHYPLGETNGGTDRPGRYLPEAGLTPEAMSEMLAMQNYEYEIMLGDSMIHSGDAGNETEGLGVSAQLAQTKGGDMEYTLTIRRGDLVPWIKPGARLRMTVESAAMKVPEGRDRGRFRERMREPDGDMGPTGGGRGGMHGGRRRGQGGEQQRAETSTPPNKPIHLEFEIQLSSN